MSEQIIEIIGDLLAAGFLALLSWFAVKFKEWIAAKTSQATQETIYGIINNFVRAAQQLYKLEDPDGSIRNKYVKDNLIKLGFIITEEINAYIESKVFDLKQEEKMIQE